MLGFGEMSLEFNTCSREHKMTRLSGVVNIADMSYPV